MYQILVCFCDYYFCCCLLIVYLIYIITQTSEKNICLFTVFFFFFFYKILKDQCSWRFSFSLRKLNGSLCSVCMFVLSEEVS
jgi:hypothetical protein